MAHMPPRWIGFALALAVTATANGQFAFRQIDEKSVELTENGNKVFTYNFGRMIRDGVPPDRARCCYLHPVYAPNGAVITDDFPRDHYHHRGISWMWMVVNVDGEKYDLWTIRGILNRSEKWETKSGDTAQLVLHNGWYVGERKVVQEDVEITVHPAKGNQRDLDFALRFTPVNGANVSIAGSPDLNKGYGGFNIRFAPRTGTRIDTARGKDVADSDLIPNEWAELTGVYAGKTATARITVDPSSAGYPNGWCLRHYGFLGADYPGLSPIKLDPAKPLAMKFRVTLTGGVTESARRRNVLVYTKNGKGYVHDNIADSVAAIRKMGAENGFNVDASADPNVITTANLAQYDALVFSNTNNETFDNEAQREAFRQFVESGKGFVGIHSATGSERNWPGYWQIIGGKFRRHPKLQPFTVRVADASNPATKNMDSSFVWTDECYFNDFLNPDLHPLLVTDPAKLEDKDRAQNPFDLVGPALPLSWTITTNGTRRFYTALGHRKESYSDPVLYKHILGGILWSMEGRK